MTMPAETITAPSDQLNTLVPEVMKKLFGEHALRHDLREGTTNSLTDTRLLYLSADFLHGVHAALELETGDAWRVVLKHCGYIWGKRVDQGLQNDLRVIAQQNLKDMPVSDYVKLVEDYFAHHGWGQLSIDLRFAERDGVVRVELRNSLFESALGHVDGPVDDLIAGMLRGLLEGVSGGEDLDCVQISHSRAGDSDRCQFLLSSAARIDALEDAVKQGAAPDAVLEQLRGG